LRGEEKSEDMSRQIHPREGEEENSKEETADDIYSIISLH
jgi:hypothetical protein